MRRNLKLGQSVDVPLGHRKDRLVRGLGDDAHLVRADCVKETTRLHDAFRADQAHVGLVHNVGNGRVEHDRAWDALGHEAVVGAQPLPRRTALGDIDADALLLRLGRGEEHLHHHTRVSVREDDLRQRRNLPYRP